LKLHLSDKLIDQMLRHHTSEVSSIRPKRTKIHIHNFSINPTHRVIDKPIDMIQF